MKRIILILISLVLTGCVPSTKIYLYNNTTDTLLISTSPNKDNMKLLPKEVIELYASSPNNLVINKGSKKWIYTQERLDILNLEDTMKDYVKKLIPIGYEISIQVNDNGLLYILPNNESFPLKNREKQPYNFPLSPLTTKIANKFIKSNLSFAVVAVAGR